MEGLTGPLISFIGAVLIGIVVGKILFKMQDTYSTVELVGA